MVRSQHAAFCNKGMKPSLPWCNARGQSEAKREIFVRFAHKATTPSGCIVRFGGSEAQKQGYPLGRLSGSEEEIGSEPNLCVFTPGWLTGSLKDRNFRKCHGLAHAGRIEVVSGHMLVKIDGAQFFCENSEGHRCHLLRALGLTKTPWMHAKSAFLAAKNHKLSTQDFQQACQFDGRKTHHKGGLESDVREEEKCTAVVLHKYLYCNRFIVGIFDGD